MPLHNHQPMPLHYHQPVNAQAGAIPFALGPGNIAPVNLPGPANPLPAPAGPNIPAPALAFNVPVNIPPPIPNIPDDPFAPVPGNVQVQFGGHQYNHLPAALAQQLATIPPALPPVRRGRGRGRFLFNVSN